MKEYLAPMLSCIGFLLLGVYCGYVAEKKYQKDITDKAKELNEKQ